MLLNQGNGRQTVRLTKRQSSKRSRIFVTLQSGGCSVLPMESRGAESIRERGKRHVRGNSRPVYLSSLQSLGAAQAVAQWVRWKTGKAY